MEEAPKQKHGTEVGGPGVLRPRNPHHTPEHAGKKDLLFSSNMTGGSGDFKNAMLDSGGCATGKHCKPCPSPAQTLPAFPISLSRGFLKFLSQVHIIQVEKEDVFSGKIRSQGKMTMHWKSGKFSEVQASHPPRSEAYTAKPLGNFFSHQLKKTSRNLKILWSLRKVSNVKDRIKNNKQGKRS